MVQYSAKDIKVLQYPEMIRQRPRLYVGDTTAESLHDLIFRLVRTAIDPKFANDCTSLTVTIQADGSLSVRDNGRGQPVYPYPLVDPRPVIETIMTSSGYGGWSPDLYQRFGNLFDFGSIINALSEWLVLETDTDAIKYQMTCVRGHISQSLHAIGKSNDKGTYLRFKPDETIWSEPNFNIDILANGLKLLGTEYPEVTILLLDEQTDTRIVLGKR